MSLLGSSSNNNSLRQRASQFLKTHPSFLEGGEASLSCAELELELRLLRAELLIQNEDLVEASDRAQKMQVELKACKKTQATELERANQLWRMISSCSQAVARASGEVELIQEICRIIHSLGEYPMVWAGLSDNSQVKKIRPTVCVGFKPDPSQVMNSSWDKVIPGQSLIDLAFRTCQASAGRDFLDEVDLAPEREPALQQGVRSCLALPLLSEGKIYGVLAIYAAQPSAFDSKEAWFLRELADDLAFGLRTLGIHKERDQLLQQLETRTEQLRILATELSDSEQRERRRIAQYLYEDLRQLLSGAQYRVESLLRQATTPEMSQTLGSLHDALQEAMASCKSLSNELIPLVLYAAGHGLGPALEWLGKWMGKKHGFVVQVNDGLKQRILSEQASTFLYQAARELLYNALKHAETNVAQLYLSIRENDQLELLVQDHGKGFDPKCVYSAPSLSKGLGLMKIHERLELLGGSMLIESSVGQGTRIVLRVPLGPSASPAEKSHLLSCSLPAAQVSPPAQLGATSSNLQQPHQVEPSGHKIRVVLADDHALIRQGLAGVLQSEPDIEVVGQAEDGFEALKLIQRLRPDVVVMDVGMPRLGGIEATQRITTDVPQCRVIGLTMFISTEIEKLMRKAGAVAYLSKTDPTDELLATIRRVMRPRK